MPTNNTTSQYGEVTKVFHWLTAALIIAIIPLGLIANGAPFATSEELANKAWLFSLHKTLGVTVFFVALLRILWALRQVKPAALHPDRKAETLLAEVVHWLLYGSLVLAPLSGWIHHAATTGFAPIWWPFGQNLPLVPKDEHFAELFGNLHWIWTKVMAASIFLHVVGALKHQFIDKDITLRRMWFGNTAITTSDMHQSTALAPVIAAAIFATTGIVSAQFNNAQHEHVEQTALVEVTSEWRVEGGTIGISVKQFGNAVEGSFADWTSAITFDPETGLGNVETQIAMNSLTLGSVTSQALGGDFLDATNHATAIFTADITPHESNFIARGTLSIKGQTVPIELPFTLNFENDTAFVSGTTTVDRLAFNVGQSMPDETNLAFPVAITIELQATRQR